MTETTKKGAAAPAAPKLSYKLKYPTMIAGEMATEIDYRRPKGRDMREWMNGRSGAGDDLRKLMANLCELPESVFDDLDGEDFMGLSDCMSDFLPKARATSTT